MGGARRALKRRRQKEPGTKVDIAPVRGWMHRGPIRNQDPKQAWMVVISPFPTKDFDMPVTIVPGHER